MSDDHDIQIALRIPGQWAHPGELIERLPEGMQITPEELTLPGGETFEFLPMPPDDQFAEIFISSCRQPPSREERTAVNNYSVNIGLTGPGGSLEAAATMLEAGAAIVRAGGAGVFIDNCGLSHGGAAWLEMADGGGPDAASYAFVALIRGQEDLSTMGMHVLGYPELMIKNDLTEADGEPLVTVLRYVCSGEKLVGEGHVLADESGPRFQCVAAETDATLKGSPMHNPFGRLRLVEMKEIAEGN